LKLIIGLGNPGTRYKLTRHNMGFLVLDQLASDFNIPLTQKGFDAVFGKGIISDQPVYIAKPKTFMNMSGVSVKKFADYFKADCKDIIVIHDDLDLPFPSIQIKAGGGHAGHKGLISIISHLGNSDFARIRLGIGKPPIKSMTEEYVLKPFTQDELKDLANIVSTGSNALAAILSSGLQPAMNQYNA
jgi:PTH1 family peptidyl-tRNA hydrolase